MKSIVAIQLKRIGDLVLTVPALAHLKKTYPEAHVTLVIDDDTAGLSPALDCVDKILIYRKNSLNFSILRQLLFKRYDAALDFTGSDRSALLTALSGAKQRITFQTPEKSFLRSMPYNQSVESLVREKHTIDRCMDLLTGLDISAGDSRLALTLPKEAYARVSEVLTGRKIDSSYIVIHAGAARAEKYWSPERWGGVIKYCETVLRIPCLLIGGQTSMEKEAAHQIKLHADFIDLSGQLDLMSSAALIAGALIFIGIDSGPSHLACAMQTPQITMYGPTNPFHWRARHSKSIVLQGGKQNPLTSFESHSTPGDLNALSTGEVIDAINLLLPPP